jgi:hypothetical protein
MSTSTILETLTTESLAIYQAVLFQPDEANQVFDAQSKSGNGVFPAEDSVLLVKVDEQFFAAMRGHRDSFMSRVAIVETPSGASYVALVNQVESIQHRILLPLYEPRVALLFDGQDPGCLSVAFVNEKASDANGFRAQWGKDLISDVRMGLASMNAKNLREYVLESVPFAASQAFPFAMPSLRDGVQIQVASASLVTPHWSICASRGCSK